MKVMDRMERASSRFHDTIRSSAARDGDERGRLYARTGHLAAKLKRLRNSPQVEVAPCSVRGKRLGSYAAGVARVLPAAEEASATFEAFAPAQGANPSFLREVRL